MSIAQQREIEALKRRVDALELMVKQLCDDKAKQESAKPGWREVLTLGKTKSA